MNYINQIFYEGLGTILYIPVEKIINKNKERKILTNIVKFIYILIALLISFILFYTKFPIKFI